MGKKKKSYEDLDYFQKRQKTFELAEHMGIDKNDYNHTNSGRGQFADNKGDFSQLEEDVARAYANDYDVRRSLEAAKLYAKDDEERLKSIEGLPKGISHMGEAYDTYQWMKGIHKDELNNGGKFSSANDYANISDYFVTEDRQTNIYDPMDELSGRLDDLEALDGVNEELASEEPYVPSQELQSAVDNTAAYEENVLSGVRSAEIFRQNDPAEVAQGLSDQYILNLTSSMKPNVQDNINNAFAVAFGTK